jgi:hypothetical protein
MRATLIDQTYVRAARWWILGPVLLLLILGFGLFSSTGQDDSYITIWVAQALKQHGAIINLNGDRVEQSSSLAHVLILALLSAVTSLPFGTLTVVVSIVLGCVTVWLTGRLADRSSGHALAAGWLAASMTGVVYWSFGGMETTLAACAYALVASTSMRVLRQGWHPRSALGSVLATMLAVTARPEAMFVCGGALGGLVGILVVGRAIHRDDPDLPRAELKRSIWLLGSLVVLSVALLAWRHWYFGAWFPQPVTAKGKSPSPHTLTDGLIYLWTQAWGRIDGVFWILATVAPVLLLLRTVRRIPEPASLIPPLITGLGLLFIVASGGDWMEGARFLVPLVPTAVVSVLALLREWTPQRVHIAAGALVITQLAGVVAFARTESTGGPPWARAHIRPGEVAGAGWFDIIQRDHYRDLVCGPRLVDVIARVRARTGRPVTVVSAQMGLMAYTMMNAAFGQVRLLDRAGLATRDFTQCPVTSFVMHRQGGLYLLYEHLFEQRAALRRRCGIELPDVIYDVTTDDWQRAKVVDANGYRIVYSQDGYITNGSRWFPGRPVRGVEFIAVRDDLSEGISYPSVHFGQ